MCVVSTHAMHGFLLVEHVCSPCNTDKYVNNKYRHVPKCKNKTKKKRQAVNVNYVHTKVYVGYSHSQIPRTKNATCTYNFVANYKIGLCYVYHNKHLTSYRQKKVQK